MPKSNNTVWIESTRPGSVYRVFKQHKKNGLNASGQAPVFVIPEVIHKKNKLR